MNTVKKIFGTIFAYLMAVLQVAGLLLVGGLALAVFSTIGYCLLWVWCRFTSMAWEAFFSVWSPVWTTYVMIGLAVLLCLFSVVVFVLTIWLVVRGAYCFLRRNVGHYLRRQ